MNVTRSVFTIDLQHRNNANQRVRLTDWLGLPVKVVKQLRVAREHAATRGTGYESLLSVATHVFSQTIPDLEESIAACNRNMKYR